MTKARKETQDLFVPRPSRLSVRYCRYDVLPDDHDTWIEGYYQSSTTGESIPYYWSIRTGQSYKGDLPTGAGRCVTRNEIKQQPTAVQVQAQRKTVPSKDSIRGMPPPRANAEIVQSILAGHKWYQAKKEEPTVATEQSSEEGRDAHENAKAKVE